MLIVAGQQIWNTNDPLPGRHVPAFGSVGGVVYAKNNSEQLLLTCYHVVIGRNMIYNNQVPAAASLVSVRDNGIASTLGTILQVCRISDATTGTSVDAAVVRPDLALNQLNLVNPAINQVVTSARILTDADQHTLKVKKCGANTTNTSGTFIGYTPSAAAVFAPEALPFPYYNLITILGDNNLPFSSEGDSGALIVTDAGEAVGIIFMTEGVKTYAVAAGQIEDKLQVTFKKP